METQLCEIKKVAAINRDNHDELPRNNQSRDTNVPGNQEAYIAEKSGENEGKVTKKLSQEFSRTESRILGALSMLYEFLLNPHALVHSGFVPETTRISNREN